MSGFKCGGLVLTSDTILTAFSAGDAADAMSSIDPNGLILAREKDFAGLSATEALDVKDKAGTAAWEDFTKVC